MNSMASQMPQVPQNMAVSPQLAAVLSGTIQDPIPKVKTTQLTRAQEVAYQKWKSQLPKNLQYEGDYDLRGLYKSNPSVKPSANIHFPDTYKLPNHPTFSNESVYFNDKTKNWAGRWQETDSSFNYVPYNDRYKKMVVEKKSSAQ